MSLMMHVVATYLRIARKPRMSTAQRARSRMAEPPEKAAPPRALAERFALGVRLVDGFEVWTIAPRAGSDRAVLYLHGGSYISEIAAQHWDLVGDLAEAGLRVDVPLYGLAPRHTYREAYGVVTAAYLQLRADPGVRSVRIAGDSAGAGLALGLTQALLSAGHPGPERLVLIAPWLDLTLSGEGVAEVARRDPWLTPAGLIEAGRAWAGGDDPRDPRLSPLFGPLAGLPPTDLYVGTRDLFLPDARRLAKRAEETGWRLRVTECAGAVHVYPLVPAPEGRAAARRIVATLS